MRQKLIPSLAALWYAFGFSQLMLALMADASAAPAVIWLAYGLATLGGLAGALLMWRGQNAFPVFAASLGSALMYHGWLFTAGPATPDDTPIAAMVLIVTTAMTALTYRRRALA